MSGTYVHGYDPRESERLHDQAGTLVELLHGDTAYPAGARVLEAGCGVGAQTVTLAARSPQAHFVSVDLSAESAAEAERRVRAAGLQQRGVRAGRHLRAAVRRRVVRPRLRVLRARAPRAAGRGARRGEADAQAGRHDHSDRGRSRLGVLPSRQRRRPRRDPVPGDVAARGRRQLADRPPGLPAAGRGRLRRRLASHRAWSTWTRAARSSSTASRARRSPR